MPGQWGRLIISSSYSQRDMEFLAIRNVPTYDLAPFIKTKVQNVRAEFRTLGCLLPMFFLRFYVMLRTLEPSKA